MSNDETFMKVYMKFFEKMARGELILNATETKLFGILGLNANYGGIVKLTQKAITKETGLPQPQISRGIKGLVEKNIIKKKRNNMGIFYQFEQDLISKGYKQKEQKRTAHLKVINGKKA